MPCGAICALEQNSRDPASLGVVSSHENIHRGFFPSDFASNGTAKPSSFRAKQLWEGQLSVWRVGPHVQITMDELVLLLDPLMVRNNGAEKFVELKATAASGIRNHHVNDHRSFCVLDECTFTPRGDKHPAHAHIAICEHLKQEIDFKDETFSTLQEGLKLLFDNGQRAWRRPET